MPKPLGGVGPTNGWDWVLNVPRHECKSIDNPPASKPGPFVQLRLFETAVEDTYSEAQKVLLKKHRDYGPKNISRSPGGPLNGLMVRMYDKLARLENLLANGATPENESLRDTFLDLANYGIIGMLVLDGKWPE